MLKMKWMTGLDGRLAATWEQSLEVHAHGGRKETIMVKMKWTMDRTGRWKYLRFGSIPSFERGILTLLQSLRLTSAVDLDR
jgi:hypothetical protein